MDLRYLKIKKCYETFFFRERPLLSLEKINKVISVSLKSFNSYNSYSFKFIATKCLLFNAEAVRTKWNFYPRKRANLHKFLLKIESFSIFYKF